MVPELSAGIRCLEAADSSLIVLAWLAESPGSGFASLLSLGLATEKFGTSGFSSRS